MARNIFEARIDTVNHDPVCSHFQFSNLARETRFKRKLEKYSSFEHEE